MSLGEPARDGHTHARACSTLPPPRARCAPRPRVLTRPRRGPGAVCGGGQEGRRTRCPRPQRAGLRAGYSPTKRAAGTAGSRRGRRPASPARARRRPWRPSVWPRAATGCGASESRTAAATGQPRRSGPCGQPGRVTAAARHRCRCTARAARRTWSRPWRRATTTSSSSSPGGRRAGRAAGRPLAAPARASAQTRLCVPSPAPGADRPLPNAGLAHASRVQAALIGCPRRVSCRTTRRRIAPPLTMAAGMRAIWGIRSADATAPTPSRPRATASRFRSRPQSLTSSVRSAAAQTQARHDLSSPRLRRVGCAARPTTSWCPRAFLSSGGREPTPAILLAAIPQAPVTRVRAPLARRMSKRRQASHRLRNARPASMGR